METITANPESVSTNPPGQPGKPDSLKVVLFTDADVFAGTERHMLDLGRGLQDAGASVRIACPVPSVLNEKAPAYGIGILPIAKAGIIDLGAISSLRRLLTEGSVDVIHSHNGRTALTSALAVRLAGRGVAIATQHFLEPGRLSRRGPAAWASRIAHGWVNRNTRQFIAISEAARAGMLERGDDAKKITVVPNGISNPESETLADPVEVRRGLGIDAAAPLVVCAARLEREKDVSSLIAAMARVREGMPSARCVVAGDGALADALRQQIRTAGLESTVQLLGFRSDVLALMNAADVFVLPSIAEPFGLVILEAMALGKPVVATRAGGPMEIVVDGTTGLLVEPRQAEAMAQAISRLLSQPEERKRFGSAGLQRFDENYTAQRMAGQLLGVYQQALASAGCR